MIANIKIPEQNVSMCQFDSLKSVCATARLKEPTDYYFWGELPEGKTKANMLQASYDKEHTDDFRIIASNHENHVVDVVMVMNNCPWLRFEVLNAIMSYQVNTPEILIHKFYEMSERLSKTVDTFNDRCNVNIGGNTLIQFNRVKVCEDYCTDQLQGELEEGWRIIAVCVQPDGRRPDYVLGKTEIQ